MVVINLICRNFDFYNIATWFYDDMLVNYARKKFYNTGSRTSRICDRHFLTCDFIRDLQNELLNGRIRKHLKAGAVPTINLLPTENKRHIRTERNNRAIKRERKEIVKNLLLQGKNKFCSTCYWKILLYF